MRGYWDRSERIIGHAFFTDLVNEAEMMAMQWIG
jgi:hypothetical protein